LSASLLRVVRIVTMGRETRRYGVRNSLLTGGQLAVTSLKEEDFEFLGKSFFEFSYLMKAKDLFIWHYRNFALLLKYQKTVFPIHPSLYLYSSALPNERMKATVRFLPSFVSSEIGDFFMFAYLEGWRTIHSFRYFGNLIHICIQGGFSNTNESILHLYSKLHLLYRCGLWNLRFLSCISFVNLHSPSNYHTFIRLRVNEWRLQIFHCLHFPIFKELRSWQNQWVFWLSQLVQLLKWTVCFGKLKQFGLSKHTIHFDDYSSVILQLLLCPYSATRL